MNALLGTLGGLAVLLGGWLCWRAGGRAADRLGKRAGELAAVCVLLLGGSLVLLVNYNPSLLPAAVVVSPLIYLEFVYFVLPASLFLGLCARRVPRVQTRQGLAAFAAVLSLYGGIHVALACVAGDQPGLDGLPPRGPVTRQTTGWSCGAASCATLLKAHGIRSSEREMAELCLTLPKRGTSLPRFVRGLTLRLASEGSLLRVLPRERLDMDDLDAFPKPALLSIRHTALANHAVVLLRRRPDGLYEVAEPLSGTIDWMERGELEARFTGEAIALVDP